MNDLISRQAAIDAISYSEIAYYPGEYDSEVLRRDSVVKQAILSIVPIDAQPKRKKGEWIIMSEFLGGCTDRCSVCGWEYDYNGYVDEQEYYNYCPNCGADMRGNDGKTESD